MGNPNVVAVFASHTDAEAAVRNLQKAQFDMKKLSIVGKDFQTEEHAVGFYNLGDRVKAWGRLGAFWGSIGSMLFGSALLLIPVVGHVIVLGPIVSTFVELLEGAVVGGGVGMLGAALASVGVPKDSVIRYESEVKAGRFLVIAHGSPEEVANAKALLAQSVALDVASTGA